MSKCLLVSLFMISFYLLYSTHDFCISMGDLFVCISMYDFFFSLLVLETRFSRKRQSGIR